MILCYFLIIVWQVILIIKDKANNISAFIIMTAFLAIFISWYNPKKVKRNLLESIKEIETDYISLSYLMIIYPCLRYRKRK